LPIPAHRTFYLFSFIFFSFSYYDLIPWKTPTSPSVPGGLVCSNCILARLREDELDSAFQKAVFLEETPDYRNAISRIELFRIRG
jgi:hypothetical protein